MPSDTTTILAFDTSAAQCAAVLLRGNDILATRHKELGRAQVEGLFPMLEEMLQTENVGWHDLNALAVCTGPGNFTGTRIGVSAARGLAMSLKIPAIGVTVFEAAALAASDTITGEITGEIHVGISLPRQQFGMQRFSNGQPPEAKGKPEICVTGANSPFDIADIAQFALLRLAQGTQIPRPAPLYLRPADAAPAKDKPPVILDDC